MAKRIFLALLLVTLAAGGAFAQVQLSAGAGGNFAVSFDSFKYDGEDAGSGRTVGGGAFAFFDATYVEADVGLLFGGQKSKEPDGDWEDGLSVTYLTLAVYGKYPIDLGGFTLFPMLGVQMNLGLGASFDGEAVEFDDPSKGDYLNLFWIKAGVGADFSLSEKLYLRPSLLYGINFGSKVTRDAKSGDDKYSSFHHGLDVRVALGFKF
jgi:hypothetical protein